MTPLVPQTLNLNGTSGDELLRQYVQIDNAIQMAKEAVQMAQPHGRDFQTARDPNAAQDARTAFSERWLALDIMQKEFDACALAVAEQHWERNKRMNEK